MSMLEDIRTPPHSIDSEQAVLGGLMLDERAFAKIADWLGEQDFYREDHRLIFRAIKSLSEASKPCDAVTMAEWFQENGLTEAVGGVEYVIRIADATPSAANITAYAEIVREKSQLRSIIEVGTRLSSAAYDASGRTATDLIALASHHLAGMSAASVRGGLAPAKAAMKLQFAEMNERYKLGGDKLIGLPTPWAEVNKLTKGLRNGVLYVIGGRPSMGKSILGVQIAVFNALRGVRAALFSVEMTAAECMSRACSACGNIPHDWVDQPIDEGCPDSEIYWQRYSAITEAIISCPLLIDDTAGLTIEQFMARARREHMRKPIQLLVGDHIHDFAIDPKREARHEYGRIAQGFKTLAKEFNCPAVALAQLSRASAHRADKRPTLTDLRESGEIEQKGDVILFVHREDYYDREDTCAWKGLIELIPAKGRNIKIDKSIILANEFDYMRAADYDGPRPSVVSTPSRDYSKRRTLPKREAAHAL